MVRVAAFALDLLFLAGGFPVAMLLARLTTGSAWPWATALLWLSGAAVYGLGLRLSPLKATLAQDLLGLRNRAKAPGQAAPGLEAAMPSPPASPTPAAPTPPPPAIPAVRNLSPPRLSPRPTPFGPALPATPPTPAPAPGASPSPPTTMPESPSAAGVPCPRCGLTNRRDCRFCKACGTPLAPRLCPACSKTAAPDARFCKSCGRPLP